jgi:GTPase-activating protein SAC7
MFMTQPMSFDDTLIIYQSPSFHTATTLHSDSPCVCVLATGVTVENENHDVEETIRTYQRLIGELPKLNGQLLLYILDLLAVFAENGETNLMPAANLAAIFQPGLISHPDHDLNPQQYKVSQEVLIFLIEHQDRFLPTSAAMKRPDTPPSPGPGVAPPARYGGKHVAGGAKDLKPLNIPRRKTMPKKTDMSSFPGNVLRRHRSTRVQQSPKLAVEEEEPRRVSEGSAPSNGKATSRGESQVPIQEASRLSPRREGKK